MKYFKLLNALDDKIIGPNLDQVSYQKPSTILFNSWEYPKIDNTIELELEDNALITDFLKASSSMSATGFYISDKVKNILSSYNLVDHKYYETRLTEVDNLVYSWLHIVDLSVLNSIDYKSSIFFETDFGDVIGTIEIESYEKYKRLKKEKGVFFDVEFESCKLKKSFNYDLFTLLPFDPYVFISEQLLAALIENKVTGFRYSESSIEVL